MEVMTQGFELVREIRIGDLHAADRSTLRGLALLPLVDGDAPSENGRCGCRSNAIPAGQNERTPLTRIASFDAEFRGGLGYNQPASPLASVGVMAAGSGDTASKYVARRETPLYIPENCTQCMECIAVCPDTALPNCSQDLDTILRTAVSNYVTDGSERKKMLGLLPEITRRTREMMRDAVARNERTPAQDFIRQVTHEVNGFSPKAKDELFAVIDKVPMAYQKADAIFATPEKKSPGSGGIFSIFVSDLCKGCAACVTACGGTTTPSSRATARAPAAARRASCGRWPRSPRRTCVPSITRRRTASAARPISSKRPACRSSPTSRRAARNSTTCSA